MTQKLPLNESWANIKTFLTKLEAGIFKVQRGELFRFDQNKVIQVSDHLVFRIAQVN